ncbi:MAG: energy transducer TonB [Nitrospirota bacterium]|nr:energy transducer TonB [Nitrospirota bacterium]
MEKKRRDMFLRERIGTMKEQIYGTITSISIHTIIITIFLMLSIHKNVNDVKTFYIQFTQTGGAALQWPSTSKVMKKHKVSGIREKDVIEKAQDNKLKEEPPLRKELPVEQKETLGETDTSDKHEAVNVTAHPVTGIAESQQISDKGHLGGQNTGIDIPSMASSGNTSPGIETEFGSKGAPAFLKRQLPVYPVLARKLGKEGKVVLRLFINEKGRLLNVEVVEPAGYGFTESAMEAVKMSTFFPAHENGIGIASKALLSIRFVLKRI